MHWLVVIHLGAGTLARGCSEISLRVTPPAAASPQQQWRALLPAAPQLLQLLQSWQLLYREYYETCGDARAVEINASDIVRFSEIEFRQLAERLAAEFNGWLASESFASAIETVVSIAEASGIVLSVSGVLEAAFSVLASEPINEALQNYM